MEVSSQGAPAALVDDLAAQVFQYVGCAKASIPAMTEAIESAVARSTAGSSSRCDVQFRARNGKLDILVMSNGGRIFQETIFIP